jgi:hypothetical protein
LKRFFGIGNFELKPKGLLLLAKSFDKRLEKSGASSLIIAINLSRNSVLVGLRSLRNGMVFEHDFNTEKQGQLLAYCEAI